MAMMAAKGVAVMMVFLVLASPCAALKCYQCVGCGSSQGTSMDCGPVMDVCMKITFQGQVMKTCNVKQACSLDTLKQINPAAWDSVKDVHNEQDIEKMLAEMIHCCEGDYCNTAASLPKPLLVLLAPLVYLLRQ